MLRTFFISVFLIFFFNISACNPLAGGDPHLYSSSYLEEDLYAQARPVHEVQGLTNVYLKRLFDRVSCDDFKSHIWTHIYITLFNQQPPPSPLTVQRRVKSFAQDYLLQKGANSKVIRQFAQNFSKIYEQALSFFADKTTLMIMEEIALIELMDDPNDPSLRSHVGLVKFVTELDKTFNSIEKIISPLSLSCVQKKSARVTPERSHPRQIHPLVYGARKVMATAYQSCKALNLPLIHSRSPETRGIREISTSKGGGVYRSIASLPQLLSSHYYLSQVDFSPPSPQCPNISKNPLLYDFGGKPFVSMHPYPRINLFKNSGSGSHILGLDCSGFVMSALATAGLRIKKNKFMKSSYISGVSSWIFKDTSNNLNCFEQVTKSSAQPIKAGDVIAISGHIMIVDQIGKDPLGIDRIKSPYQCHQIELDQLNFSIIQSSSDLNAIGINRMHIQSTTDEQLIKGLTDWAIYNCEKKWDTYNSFKNNGISISRHKLTKECQEHPMHLVGQECVTSCAP